MRRRLLPLLVVILVLAGCAAAGSGPEVPSDAPSVPTAEGFSVEALVAGLPPLDGDPLVISIGDVAGATELAGLDRPESDVAAIAAWVEQTAGFEADDIVSLPWPETLGVYDIARHDEFRAAVGFGIPDVDAFAWAYASRQSVTVLEGRFDLGAIGTALGDPVDDIWSQPGDELAPDVTSPGVVDRLGRPVSVAGDAERLVVALERRDAAAALTGEAGAGEPLLRVARLLDEAGVYAAQMLVTEEGARAIGLRADGPGWSAVVVVADSVATPPQVGDRDDIFEVTSVDQSDGAWVAQLTAEGYWPAIAWQFFMLGSPLLRG